MKIAITGSSGIVGNVLKRKLNKKYDILCIDLSNADINVDLINPSGIFDNVDVVIHLAGNKNNTDNFENLLNSRKAKLGVNEPDKSINKNLMTKVDILGRKIRNKGFQLHIYDNGSVEKKYFIK